MGSIHSIKKEKKRIYRRLIPHFLPLQGSSSVDKKDIFETENLFILEYIQRKMDVKHEDLELDLLVLPDDGNDDDNSR